MVTNNFGDFVRLHRQHQAADVKHAVIILAVRTDPGTLVPCLERAARLLAPTATANQLLHLDYFEADE